MAQAPGFVVDTAPWFPRSLESTRLHLLAVSFVLRAARPIGYRPAPGRILRIAKIFGLPRVRIFATWLAIFAFFNESMVTAGPPMISSRLGTLQKRWLRVHQVGSSILDVALARCSYFWPGVFQKLAYRVSKRKRLAPAWLADRSLGTEWTIGVTSILVICATGRLPKSLAKWISSRGLRRTCPWEPEWNHRACNAGRVDSNGEVA
jgi:hypothetical protein